MQTSCLILFSFVAVYDARRFDEIFQMVMFSHFLKSVNVKLGESELVVEFEIEPAFRKLEL